MDKITKLIEQSEFWMLALSGWEVTQCRIDYAFGLELEQSGTSQVRIRIGETFIFRLNGNEYRLSAETEPTMLAPALAVLHQKVESILAFKNGALEVNFFGNMHIFVPPDVQHEAWELSGPEGLLMVCPPGGGLSIWRPEEC